MARRRKQNNMDQRTKVILVIVVVFVVVLAFAYMNLHQKSKKLEKEQQQVEAQIKKEKEKKEQIFETYCSFLPEDLLLLGKESKKYQHDWEWVNQNFDKLHEQMTGDEAVISMGVKIYTCRGESISKGQRGM